ncbi:MAG: hypothetical protein HKN47_12530 [Pirellulaceae bacterium]|nr:hypothetical protein [Pirellulaceae bacterium]
MQYESKTLDLLRRSRPSPDTDASGPPGLHVTELVPLAEVERRYMTYVLDSVGGNQTRAAKILGIDRKTLYRKLKQAESRARSRFHASQLHEGGGDLIER